MVSHSKILGARELHGVRDVTAYRQAQATACGRRGVRVHVVTEPVDARIDGGRWLIDCACGAGNATSPEFGLACCFECGAVHEQIRFPPNASEIEASLLQVPKDHQRFWTPGETPPEVQAETPRLTARKKKG